MFRASNLIKALVITSLCQGLTIYENTPNNENFTGSNKKTNNILETYISPYRYEYKNPQQITSGQPVIAATVNVESEITNTNTPFNGIKLLQRTVQKSAVEYNNEIYHHNNREASSLANNDQKYPKFIIRKQRNLKNAHNNDNDDADEAEKLIEQNSKELQPTSVAVYDNLNEAAASLSSTQQPPSSKSTSLTSHEIRYLHDIFLNYPKPHYVNYGHVELSPVLFEKRFETLKAGNRYKGEVMWLDNTGGYAQHFWDLAQGKL